MGFLYGSTTKPHYCSLSRNSEKCKEEQPSGFLVHSAHLPPKEIEALAGLTPIHLHLKKPSGRSQLRVSSFPRSYQNSFGKSTFRLVLITSSFIGEHDSQIKTKNQELNYRCEFSS